MYNIKRKVKERRKERKMKTALARNEAGNLSIIRDDFYSTNDEMAKELRANGFKVLKVWDGDISDRDVEEWEFLNRK